MPNSLFISVMSPSDDDGSISLHITTRVSSYTAEDTSDNSHETLSLSDLVDFTVTLNVSADTSEIALADQIAAALGTYLKDNDLNYNGWLAYAEETYTASFQVTRTDSFICVWSQALFNIELETDCGALIEVASAPALITLAEMVEISPTLIVNGSQLTDELIIKRIIKQSAFLTRGLRNNIVISTYVKEYKGTDTSSINLTPGPVIDFDQPRVRRKYCSYYGLGGYGKAAYGLTHDGKKLRFIYNEIYVDTGNPFAKDNLIYLSYIAGYNTIPEEIKTVVGSLVIYGLTGNPGLKSMKGGSGAFEFLTSSQQLKQLVVPVMIYKG